MVPVVSRSEPASVLHVRADRGGRLFTACNGLRTRSLKLASNRANRHTKAAPAAAILVSESGATGETKKAAQRFSAIGR